jgi:SOS response regulatory protein OraA/RecX
MKRNTDDVMTAQQALERLMRSCSRYETCSRKVKEKLRYWRLSAAEQDEVLQQLTTLQFVDDARFARNFARSKSKWKAAQKKRLYP